MSSNKCNVWHLTYAHQFNHFIFNKKWNLQPLQSLVLSTINFWGTFLLSRSTTCCQVKVPKMHSISSHRAAPAASPLPLGWGISSWLTYFSAFPTTATSRARAGAGLWAPSAGKLGRSRARPLIPPTPLLRGRDMGGTGLIFLIFSVLQRSCQSPKSSEPFCCLGDFFFIFKQGKGPLGVSYAYIVKHPKMSLLRLNITVI